MNDDQLSNQLLEYRLYEVMHSIVAEGGLHRPEEAVTELMRRSPHTALCLPETWKAGAEMFLRSCGRADDAELNALSASALGELLARDPSGKMNATEMIAEAFMERNRVRTTRDDAKAEMWLYRDGIYVPQGRTHVREFCRRVLGKGYADNIASAVEAKIEADTYVDQKEFFDSEPSGELAVANGRLVLRTRELLPFTPDVVFFSKLPVIYCPGMECPAVRGHFSAVLKHAEDVPVMEELFGYLLYKDAFLEKAVMFVGTGRNGKSKTIELMKLFLGPDNCANVPLAQLDADRFAQAELFKRMANLAGDIGRQKLENTGTFKSLTGRDLVSADRKFRTRVHFVNYAKMVFSANELPRTDDISPAFWKRWLIIEFPYTFVTKEEFDRLPEEARADKKLMDPDIVTKIAHPEEMSGLLNAALDGLDRLLAHGDFSRTRSMDEVREMWIRRSDSVAAFLMEKVVEDKDLYIVKSDFRRRYTDFCREHSLRVAGDRDIRETITRAMAATSERIMVDEGQAHVWKGVGWK